MRTNKPFAKSTSLVLVVLTALLASAALQPARAENLTPGGKNLWRAVVQLGPVAMVKTKAGKTVLRYFGWGSGTILTPNGLILTNHHVTDVSDLIEEVKDQKNIKIQEGKMVVLLTKSPDQPPVATYIATVVGSSAKLDLAVVRITHDLTGKEIDPASLNLPYLTIGDSDSVQLEDTLRIYGYPTIGGNTITFTKGNVSGFDNEQGVKGRAWIKTDATISGGNSGGTAVNDAGQLIGVPTQAAVSSAERITDCRRVQDTNGDGEIDEKDSCIPIGGFINALRPVNLAASIIQAARRAATGIQIGGEDEEEDANTEEDEDSDEAEDATVTEGVQIVGTIVDAGTGKPVAGAVFVVLVEGVTWDEFSGSDDEVYEAVNTDRKGRFEMTKLLERGKSYSIGWGAKGYQPVKQDNLKVTDETPDVVEAKLKLQKQ